MNWVKYTENEKILDWLRILEDAKNKNKENFWPRSENCVKTAAHYKDHSRTIIVDWPGKTDKSDMMMEFSRFGRVVAEHVMHLEGLVGWITYDSVEAAQTAVRKMNGEEKGNSLVRVESDWDQLESVELYRCSRERAKHKDCSRTVSVCWPGKCYELLQEIGCLAHIVDSNFVSLKSGLVGRITFDSSKAARIAVESLEGSWYGSWYGRFVVSEVTAMLDWDNLESYELSSDGKTSQKTSRDKHSMKTEQVKVPNRVKDATVNMENFETIGDSASPKIGENNSIFVDPSSNKKIQTNSRKKTGHLVCIYFPVDICIFSLLDICQFNGTVLEVNLCISTQTGKCEIVFDSCQAAKDSVKYLNGILVRRKRITAFLTGLNFEIPMGETIEEYFENPKLFVSFNTIKAQEQFIKESINKLRGSWKIFVRTTIGDRLCCTAKLYKPKNFSRKTNSVGKSILVVWPEKLPCGRLIEEFSKFCTIKAFYFEDLPVHDFVIAEFLLETTEDVKRVVKNMNGMLVGNKSLMVEEIRENFFDIQYLLQELPNKRLDVNTQRVHENVEADDVNRSRKDQSNLSASTLATESIDHKPTVEDFKQLLHSIPMKFEQNKSFSGFSSGRSDHLSLEQTNSLVEKVYYKVHLQFPIDINIFWLVEIFQYSSNLLDVNLCISGNEGKGEIVFNCLNAAEDCVDFLEPFEDFGVYFTWSDFEVPKGETVAQFLENPKLSVSFDTHDLLEDFLLNVKDMLDGSWRLTVQKTGRDNDLFLIRTYISNYRDRTNNPFSKTIRVDWNTKASFEKLFVKISKFCKIKAFCFRGFPVCSRASFLLENFRTAKRAIRYLNGLSFDDVKLDVDFAEPSPYVWLLQETPKALKTKKYWKR